MECLADMPQITRTSFASPVIAGKLSEWQQCGMETRICLLISVCVYAEYVYVCVCVHSLAFLSLLIFSVLYLFIKLWEADTMCYIVQKSIIFAYTFSWLNQPQADFFPIEKQKWKVTCIGKIGLKRDRPSTTPAHPLHSSRYTVWFSILLVIHSIYNLSV